MRLVRTGRTVSYRLVIGRSRVESDRGLSYTASASLPGINPVPAGSRHHLIRRGTVASILRKRRFAPRILRAAPKAGALTKLRHVPRLRPLTWAEATRALAGHKRRARAQRSANAFHHWSGWARWNDSASRLAVADRSSAAAVSIHGWTWWPRPHRPDNDHHQHHPPDDGHDHRRRGRLGRSGTHSTGQREVQFEPVSQVLDLAIHCGGHGPVEGHVLVDRVDPQHPGVAVGGGVELPHQPVAVQDR